MRKALLHRSSWTSLALVAILAGGARGQALRSTLVQAGFTQPLYVTSPPGDTQRLFVVEHGGVIKIIKNGTLLGTPFMDINSIVGGGQAQSDERGLLGLAFHPNFAANRKFYVDYTDNAGATVVREYLADSGNPDVADMASFTTIFGPLSDPQSNHNGGTLQFGPDAKLYLSLGDGGNANDTGGGHDPVLGNGQSLSTYWGKMLRIDVDNPPTYVAAGNPFAAGSFPHIWSYGWRNPWRFSFDRSTGDMYVGDVGQGSREEVSFQPASSTGGENYGWKCMEGINCSGLGGCTCGSASLVPPIQDYSHALGCTVVGGYVYRGSMIPSLQGHYFYADYCSGSIWSFTYDGVAVSNFTNRTAELDPPGGLAIVDPTSFGQDANGELYICDFHGGEVYRIDKECDVPTSYCTAAPNSAGPGALMGFSGNGSFALNNLVLATSGAPPEVNGFYFYGDATSMVPLYNGFRCVAGNVKRLPVVHTEVFGDVSYAFDVTAPPAVITPGSTWHFQFFYRDPGVGAHLNYSDGLTVPFCN